MNEAGSSFADFTSTTLGSEGVTDDGTLAVNVLDGEVDTQVLDKFRNRLFSTVRELEKVRDWLASPMASGLKRGLAQWAMGNHAEALPTLEENRSNPTIANCLARSLLELGRIDELHGPPGDPDAAGVDDGDRAADTGPHAAIELFENRHGDTTDPRILNRSLLFEVVVEVDTLF